MRHVTLLTWSETVPQLLSQHSHLIKLLVWIQKLRPRHGDDFLSLFWLGQSKVLEVEKKTEASEFLFFSVKHQNASRVKECKEKTNRPAADRSWMICDAAPPSNVSRCSEGAAARHSGGVWASLIWFGWNGSNSAWCPPGLKILGCFSIFFCRYLFWFLSWLLHLSSDSSGLQVTPVPLWQPASAELLVTSPKLSVKYN